MKRKWLDNWGMSVVSVFIFIILCGLYWVNHWVNLYYPPKNCEVHGTLMEWRKEIVLTDMEHGHIEKVRLKLFPRSGHKWQEMAPGHFHKGEFVRFCSKCYETQKDWMQDFDRERERERQRNGR
jgi:hypothetical protein